jgi:hypothetical protein
VDIGVPAPARRIKPGAATQARTLTVVLVAVGGVLGVILLAFIIANLGGDGGGEASGDDGATATTGAGETATTTTTASTTPSAARGIVPDVAGLTSNEAADQIEAAGFVVRESRVANAAPQGQVIDQSPAGGVQWPEGNEVTIVVSNGP